MIRCYKVRLSCGFIVILVLKKIYGYIFNKKVGKVGIVRLSVCVLTYYLF